MRKNGVMAGLVAMGLVLFAGAASAGDDKGDETKGLVEEACVVIADGHNQAQKLELKDKEWEEYFAQVTAMKDIGSKGGCAFYEIDKYTIGVKTDGDVKPPPALGRVKGHSTGDGTLGEVACSTIGGMLDQLNTQADTMQEQGDYAGASEVLAAADQIQDNAMDGGCFFIY